MAVIICDSKHRELFIEGGGQITIDKAKEMVVAGEVENSTLSFVSLYNCGWDWDALDAYYQDLKKYP